MNLIFRLLGERQDFLGIFSLDGGQSNTASVQQKSQRDFGKNRLGHSKLLEELNSLFLLAGDLSPSMAYNRSSSDQIFPDDPSSIANWVIYRGFRG